MIFPTFFRPSWTKMNEISINTVENIDEVDQIIFLTTCTTKLHRYYRVTLQFLDFHQKNFPEIPLLLPFLILTPRLLLLFIISTEILSLFFLGDLKKVKSEKFDVSTIVWAKGDSLQGECVFKNSIMLYKIFYMDRLVMSKYIFCPNFVQKYRFLRELCHFSFLPICKDIDQDLQKSQWVPFRKNCNFWRNRARAFKFCHIMTYMM